MADYDVVLFTSANGVENVFERLDGTGRDARAFGQAKVAAIGPATASALLARGIRADVVAKEFRGEGLAAAVLEELATIARGPRRAVLFRALVARDALPEALRAGGIEVDVVPAYETRPGPRDQVDALREDLSAGRIDAVLFTSSSTVEQTLDALGGEAATLLRNTTIASIGPVTTETAATRGLRVAVTASEYTLPGLITALEAYFAARSPEAKAP
jgi:uroporphyrinogen III methyltransferase/synthase